MSCAPKCTTLGAIIDRAMALLADNDPIAPNTRWSVSTLVSFVNEGLLEIGSRLPTALASRIDMRLSPGSVQTLPSEYATLVSIDEVVNGREVRPVTAVSHRYRGRVKVPARKCSPCAAKPCDGYFVSTFTQHPVDDRTFWVDPPVPAGCPDVFVRAVVTRGAVPLTACDVNKCLSLSPGFEAQLLDWVMWRALSMDHASEGARVQAKTHYETFIKAMTDKRGVAKKSAATRPAPATGDAP